MKKLSLLFTMIFVVSALFAQKGKVNTASSYFSSGKLDKAKELIDLGIKHPKCENWYKAHFVKGQIYQGLFESLLPAYKKLSDGALETAYTAFKKVIELDVKNKCTKKLFTQYNNLVPDFTNQAVTKYNAADYEGAFVDFKTVLELENSDILKSKNIVDTPVMFYAGMTAQKIKKYEEAVNFYKEVLKYNYEPARCYAFIASCLKELGRKEESIKYLHEGYELFPNNSYMLVELINYYLLGGEPEKAEEYLDAAIKQDPSNLTFYRAKGTLYEQLKDTKKAQEMYEKVLSMDPNDFNSLYNLGLIKLNEVNEFHKKVNNIMDVDKYNNAIKKVFAMYKEVIPFYEKANKIDPKEKNTIITLKELYFRLRNETPEYMKLYKEFKAKAEAQKEPTK